MYFLQYNSGNHSLFFLPSIWRISFDSVRNFNYVCIIQLYN